MHYDRKSETRVPSHRNYPTKSQPFSLVLHDGTDSVVDLATLTRSMRNYEQGRYKPSVSA